MGRGMRDQRNETIRKMNYDNILSMGQPNHLFYGLISIEFTEYAFVDFNVKTQVLQFMMYLASFCRKMHSFFITLILAGFFAVSDAAPGIGIPVPIDGK